MREWSQKRCGDPNQRGVAMSRAAPAGEGAATQGSFGESGLA